ncbi:MAG: diadenylate cyclase CdaA [Chthoniobacterales bacterium]|nr:diadenylate cyclase CdaA [Chthoniobacterales bacterium]
MLERAWNFFLENWNSGVEILIIATVIYYGYLYLRGTPGARILMALAILILTLTLISQLLNLAVIGWMLRSFSVFLALALVVIFQPELRRALTELGSHPWLGGNRGQTEALDAVTDAVFELASKGFGALIALERGISLRQIAESGVEIDGRFSSELVLTIFHPKTVLHDGGMIVKGGRIVAAGCVFPLSQREDLERNLGLRHRAGLGLSEDTDAVCIVVSEETGQVSVCAGGRIERKFTPTTLRKRLEELILGKENSGDHEKGVAK